MKPIPLTKEEKESLSRLSNSSDYVDFLQQRDYDLGVFEPRGRRRHKSGLVVLFLIPLNPFKGDWEYDP